MSPSKEDASRGEGLSFCCRLYGVGVGMCLMQCEYQVGHLSLSLPCPLAVMSYTESLSEGLPPRLRLPIEM